MLTMHIHVGACRYSKQAGHSPPSHHPHYYCCCDATLLSPFSAVLADATLSAVERAAVIAAPLNYILLVSVCLCVWEGWGHSVHVRLCTCIVARNGTMCVH